MRRTSVSGISLALLLVTCALMSNTKLVKASSTIYIRADGRVDPPTANITSVDNVTYYFTDNNHDEIVVQRCNVIVDGSGYTLQGPGVWMGGTGIDLTGITNVTIKNMEIKAFHDGLNLNGSSNNAISGNDIVNNYGCGIGLYDSSSNCISGNNMANNADGIGLWYASNNCISGNNVTDNNWCGIWIRYSYGNSFSGNRIVNNYYGVKLYESSNNTLRNNDVSDSKHNFDVYGESLSHYIQDIDDSNTVNGKPVCYWVNRQDMAVPPDAGYVALINCTHVTVKNLNLANNGQGALLALTTNSTIAKNNITNIRKGIRIRWSSNNSICENNVYGTLGEMLYGILVDRSSNYNTISKNNIAKAWHFGIKVDNSSHNVMKENTIANNWGGGGICFLGSSNNIISRNNITQGDTGVYIEDASRGNIISGNNITEASLFGIVVEEDSSDNVVKENNIIHSWFGISICGCSGNKIFHNNFVDNEVPAFCVGSSSLWDDGNVSGGNYWSDHSCLGNPSDGSQPHWINEDNVDRYPFQDVNGWLLQPLTVTSSPTTGIPFTIDEVPYTTPITKWLPEAVCTLQMPENHSEYAWSHWLEDGDTNRTKTVTMDTNTTLTGVFFHLCDLDKSGCVDMRDIGIAGLAFGSYPNQPRWNPDADVDQDGKVNMKDIALVAKNFGKK